MISAAFSRGAFFQNHRRVEVGRVRPLDRRLTNQLLSQRVVGATSRAVHFELTPHAQRSLEIASAYLDIRMDYPADVTALRAAEGRSPAST